MCLKQFHRHFLPDRPRSCPTRSCMRRRRPSERGCLSRTLEKSRCHHSTCRQFSMKAKETNFKLVSWLEIWIKEKNPAYTNLINLSKRMELRILTSSNTSNVSVVNVRLSVWKRMTYARTAFWGRRKNKISKSTYNASKIVAYIFLTDNETPFMCIKTEKCWAALNIKSLLIQLRLQRLHGDRNLTKAVMIWGADAFSSLFISDVAT